jgi:hypothetical protein
MRGSLDKHAQPCTQFLIGGSCSRYLLIDSSTSLWFTAEMYDGIPVHKVCLNRSSARRRSQCMYELLPSMKDILCKQH